MSQLNFTVREFKEAWVAKLRSGEHKQGPHYLGQKPTNQYCCLGVAELVKCELNGEEPVYNENGDLMSGYSDALIRSSLEGLFRSSYGRLKDGVRLKNHTYLSQVNDRSLATFAEIADFIDAHPEAVFKNWPTEAE